MSLAFIDPDCQRYRRYMRRQRDVSIAIDLPGFRVKSKRALTSRDRRELERQISVQLESRQHKAMCGPIAARVRMDVAASNPPQIHSAAKVLLDAFATSTGSSTGSPLIYKDDRQIKALSVVYNAHERVSRVHAQFWPMSSFLANLSLAEHAQSFLESADFRMRCRDVPDPRAAWNAVAELRNMSAADRAVLTGLSARAANAWGFMRRRDAQRAVLRQGALDVKRLYRHYADAGSYRAVPILLKRPKAGAESAVEYLARTDPFRLNLPTVPSSSEEARAFESALAHELNRFKTEVGDVLCPLEEPTALEVLYRPPPNAGRTFGKDLDNIIRMLVPRLVEMLAPAIKPRAPRYECEDKAELEARLSELVPLPTGLVIGFTRFDIYELPQPKAYSSTGFISLGVAPDFAGLDGPFDKLESVIAEWASRANVG